MSQTQTISREIGNNPTEDYQRYFVPAIGAPAAEDLIAQANLHLGERVPDVACGTGVVRRLAAERVGAASSVTGLVGGRRHSNSAGHGHRLAGMRVVLLTISAALLALSSAEARDNRPTPGSVSCKCSCPVQTSTGGLSDLKFIGGRARWTKTRAQCRAFAGATCQVQVGDRIYEGKLAGCDTIVHRLPPGQLPGLETSPTTGKATPATNSPAADKETPSRMLDLPFKLQRRTE